MQGKERPGTYTLETQPLTKYPRACTPYAIQLTLTTSGPHYFRSLIIPDFNYVRYFDS